MNLKFVQLSLLDELIKAGEDGDNEIEVPIKGAVNVRSHPIKDFDVRLAYGDLTLIVAMLRDYVRGLEVIKEGDIYWDYYLKKFRDMADKIGKQINYDYDEHYQKCLKKAEKESNSDIGDEALSLAMKRGMAKTKPAETEAKQAS